MSDFEVRVRIRRVEPAPKPFSGRLSGVRFEPYVHRVTPDAVSDPFKRLEPLSILGWLRGRYRGQLEVFTKPSRSPTFAVSQELLARATNE